MQRAFIGGELALFIGGALSFLVEYEAPHSLKYRLSGAGARLNAGTGDMELIACAQVSI